MLKVLGDQQDYQLLEVLQHPESAIDRIVHHSVILEFDLPSYRTNAAQNRRTEDESDRPE